MAQEQPQRRRQCGGGNCVEVAVWPGGRIAVRDSKDPDGARLLFDRAEASAWLAGVKAGGFTA